MPIRSPSPAQIGRASLTRCRTAILRCVASPSGLFLRRLGGSAHVIPTFTFTWREVSHSSPGSWARRSTLGQTALPAPARVPHPALARRVVNDGPSRTKAGLAMTGDERRLGAAVPLASCQGIGGQISLIGARRRSARWYGGRGQVRPTMPALSSQGVLASPASAAASVIAVRTPQHGRMVRLSCWRVRRRSGRRWPGGGAAWPGNGGGWARCCRPGCPAGR